jgi:molecular chaperone DnaK (HSP70)
MSKCVIIKSVEIAVPVNFDDAGAKPPALQGNRPDQEPGESSTNPCCSAGLPCNRNLNSDQIMLLYDIGRGSTFDAALLVF